MSSLLSKLNYRNIILDENTQNETVAVRLKNSELRQIIWLGMIERHEALAKQKQEDVRPVKLKVHSYRAGDFGELVALKDNEYIQGCLVVGAGVFGVMVNGAPRVVKKSGNLL